MGPRANEAPVHPAQIAIARPRSAGGKNRQCLRRDHRSPNRHQGPETHQLVRALRLRRGQRCQTEQNEPDHEDALTTPSIAKDTCGELQATEHHGIRQDRAGQLGLAGTQLLRDTRQRDIQDRVVDDHDDQP